MAASIPDCLTSDDLVIIVHHVGEVGWCITKKNALVDCYDLLFGAVVALWWLSGKCRPNHLHHFWLEDGRPIGEISSSELRADEVVLYAIDAEDRS